MDTKKILLARKYAEAFYAIFNTYLDEPTIKAIAQAYPFLKKQSNFFVLALVPHIPLEQKKEIIKKLLVQHHLPLFFEKLTTMLLDQQRLMLLPEILHNIVKIYQKKHNIIEFNITSAQALSSEQLKTMVDFLASQTEKNIVYTYQKDPTLIAGIRAQSSSLLWEHSIRQQLATIQNLLINKEL